MILKRNEHRVWEVTRSSEPEILDCHSKELYNFTAGDEISLDREFLKLINACPEDACAIRELAQIVHTAKFRARGLDYMARWNGFEDLLYFRAGSV